MKIIFQSDSKIDSIPQRRKYVRKLVVENINSNVAKLINEFSFSKNYRIRSLSAHMIIPEIYKFDKKSVLKVLKNLACDEKWEVREHSAMAMKVLNEKLFEEMLPIYQKWMNSKNNLLISAICLGTIIKFPDTEKCCRLI